MITFPTVGVVGLGLIGGSFARALKAGGRKVMGTTRRESSVLLAQMEGAIDIVAAPADLAQCDIVILALPPGATVEFLEKHGSCFSNKNIVVDICGIKRSVCEKAWQIAAENGFEFIGGHPMAGKEKSGFKYSSAQLFNGASMILTFRELPSLEHLVELKQFFLSLGFGKVVLSNPSEHDRIIAHTSQLAHILSAAYVRGRTAMDHAGFAAGSFRDMIRVASMDPALWSELFIGNRDNLAGEISELMVNLALFRDAIAAGDSKTLSCLLDESAGLKSKIDAQRAAKPENAVK